MTLITRFEDLPDLVFIELFTYLSSADVLWSFININHRIRTLLDERGLIRHINLSLARRFQFDTLLTLLPLHHIETLIVNIEASPLQLARYPYLPRLTTLRLYGVRDFHDTSTFLLRHSRSLVYLTVDTNRTFMTAGSTGLIDYPRNFLDDLMTHRLPQLKALRSLNLGQDTLLGLPLWDLTSIQCSLSYLRAPFQNIGQLCGAISIGTLSSTLQQLHVTLRNLDWSGVDQLPTGLFLPKLSNLRTFSMVQTIFSMSQVEWSTIEALTSANAMPVLRQLHLALFVTADDLIGMNRSSLLTDDRGIDVQFAFIVYDDIPGIQLRQHVPHGSRSHPRQIAGTTCVVNWLTRAYRKEANLDSYFDHCPLTYDVWYTLPWAFEQFFDVLEPTQALTKIDMCTPAPWNAITTSSSGLHTLTLSHNHALTVMLSMPHVLQFDRITSVRLWFHDWPAGLHLPNLRHVSMTNNLVTLKSFALLPPSIRSMQISLQPILPNSISCNWSVLRSLSTLPMLASLHIVLNHVKDGLDEVTCQLIAEIVPTLVHFGIHFRRQCSLPVPDYSRMSDGDAVLEGYNGSPDDSLASDGYCAWDTVAFLVSMLEKYRTSIEEIHRRILRLPLPTEPVIVVEEEGCGLTVWM